jgi:tRNA(Ile)-lysidine synthase
MNAIAEQLALPERLLKAWPLSSWQGVHVLAAVSGGADSMALLRALIEARCAGHGGGRVFVGHVNHGLRGIASDDDEAWLRGECERLETPFLTRRAPDSGSLATLCYPQDAATLNFSRRQGENASRELRYRLLVAMAQEVGARYVAVAHTREDQVETVLFRLLRGSGLRGLAGMPRTRPLSSSVSLVRPLLDCSRDELRAYLAARGQIWREDATNADPRFARNRLRHEVLPQLREQFAIDEALLIVASQAADAHELISLLVEELLLKCDAEISASAVTLESTSLASQSALLTAEVLRIAWRRAGWPEQAMTRRWWTKLADLAQAPAPRQTINLPGNVLARRDGAVLRLDRLSPGA